VADTVSAAAIALAGREPEKKPDRAGWCRGLDELTTPPSKSAYEKTRLKDRRNGVHIRNGRLSESAITSW